MKIKLLITGGTIDKRYNELTAELDYDKTRIQNMLDEARSRADIDIEQLMLLDSLDITEDQRQQILQAVVNASEENIIITHGTDTMVKTAELLAKNIKDRTVVLTGSMIPYTFKDTDALFNLGAALAAVQALDSGVYVVMNGIIFSWNNVTKNKELGEFQAKS